MVNFTAFITLIMGITTFFTDKLLVARVFTWSQKLIAAPPKCTPTHLDGYEELFTLVSPVTVLKTLTTATINMTADLPTFTTIITPPGTDLALFTGTITTTSFLSLAKEFVCATLTVPAPLTANAASLVTAFLFGTILLLATVGFVASSPTVMKAEDLAYLESRLAEKDELAKSLRRSNANEAAYLRREMRFMRMGQTSSWPPLSPSTIPPSPPGIARSISFVRTSLALTSARSRPVSRALTRSSTYARRLVTSEP
jgi:hypothetical protein